MTVLVVFFIFLLVLGIIYSLMGIGLTQEEKEGIQVVSYVCYAIALVLLVIIGLNLLFK